MATKSSSFVGHVWKVHQKIASNGSHDTAKKFYR